MPDFRLQPSFPIASVVDAMQRKAVYQNQDKLQQSQLFDSAIGKIGEIGQSLFDSRKRVAQSLALGRQFDVPDEVSRTMEPEQVLQVGALKKGEVDMNMLMNILHPGTGGTTPSVSPQPATPAQPAPSPSGAALPAHTPEAILASTSPTIPMQGQPDSQIAPPPQPVPVPVPVPPTKKVNAATAKMAMEMRPENVLQYVPGKGLINVGTKTKGDQVITTQPDLAKSLKEGAQQDRLEQQAINRVATLRGDQSLARTETQRDAATQAYNTITQIKSEGRMPSQVEYYDILGQLWKARTGASPSDQAIRDLDASTFKGDIGKAFQYITGKPAGRTTEAILNNIQDFAKNTGIQSDKLHDGYWKTHLIKPTGLAQERWDPIASATHGLSFEEATGYKNAGNSPNPANPVGSGSWDQSKEARYQELLKKHGSQ